MRKFLILIFLIVLPLQWTTAAVAAYCLHETDGPAQQHMGHHAHEHQSDAAPTGDDPAGTDFDADCPSCHSHYVQAAIVIDQATVPMSADRNVISYRAFLPEPPPNSLFRPPLTDLA